MRKLLPIVLLLMLAIGVSAQIIDPNKRPSDTVAGTCDSNAKGQTYFNTTTNRIRYCDGTIWAEGDGSAGKKRVTANVTNATATMANISDLSMTLQAGRKYAGRFSFIAKNSTAGEGLQFDFNGGTATFTSIEFMFQSTPPGVTLGTTVSSAAGTAITATTATSTDVVYIVYFTCVVNAAGTMIPRIAEVSHTSGTATLVAGGISEISDIP